MTLHDRQTVRQLVPNDVLCHAALPGFELAIGTFFADALDL